MARIAVHRLADDELQPARQVRRDARQRLGIGAGDLGGERAGAARRKGALPGGQFVEHDAEREDVGTAVEIVAQRLLRAHIARRADDLAQLRLQALLLEQVALGDARDAEIQELQRLAIRRYDDVGRLHVAVDDALGVGVAERGGQLDADRDHLGRRQPTGLHHLRQRFAIEIFHDDEGIAVHLADVEDGDDAGMGQRPCRPRLAQEADRIFAVLAELGLQHLDHQRPVDVRIVGAIDVGHRAFADLLLDAITADQFQQSHPPRADRPALTNRSPAA